ncbi:MAG: hypothetical protein QNK37_23970 [Acidobacteriota bacterium]|nr:hypothetical protein [Acidobacteriota bacterium]
MNPKQSLYVLLLLLLSACGHQSHHAQVRPSLEDRTPDGAYFNPSTQSFLRGRHWLEKVGAIEIRENGGDTATVVFQHPEPEYRLTLHNYRLDTLVPRLHYQPADTPDDFDAFNLMMAEYSRNSVSVPVGKSGDSMAHFRTNLPEDVPWRLDGDYDFVPNPYVRPVRVGLINNCLAPGLWEISATDRSGEIYHAWFDMPADFYHRTTARVNGLQEDFVAKALKWHEEPVKLDLDRLRTTTTDYGTVSLTTHHEADARGFSSQDSRRKLARGFAQIHDGDQWRPPRAIQELTEGVARLTEFIPPGKYDHQGFREFNLNFLRKTRNVSVIGVEPRTSYNWRNGGTGEENQFDYLQLTIHLEEFDLLIGNLPFQLLVPQEDFSINGYGVGVLSSGGIAERREYLIADGPAPSYAYLARPDADGGYTAFNSHAYGLEQIFIRTHLQGDDAWWEVTLTSYERIVDIVKYKIPIPAQLTETARQHAMAYISPLYYTYRDDNLR